MKQLSSENREFYSKVISGINETAKMNRCIPELVTMEEYLEESKLKGIDGVLLIGGDTTIEHVKFLKQLKIPTILVDQYIPTVKVDCVVVLFTIEVLMPALNVCNAVHVLAAAVLISILNPFATFVIFNVLDDNVIFPLTPFIVITLSTREFTLYIVSVPS